MYEVVKIHHPRRFLRRKITKRIEKHRRRTASHHLRELGSDQEFFLSIIKTIRSDERRLWKVPLKPIQKKKNEN